MSREKMPKIYRVLRVLEYEGPIDWLISSLKETAVPLQGVYKINFETKIKSGLVGNLPEIIKTQLKEDSDA